MKLCTEELEATYVRQQKAWKIEKMAKFIHAADKSSSDDRRDLNSE